MKLFQPATMMLFAAILLVGHSAAAFTSDKNSDTNNDGSAKFSDPDEQFDDMTDASRSSHPGIIQFDGGQGMHSSFGVYPSDGYADRARSALQ